MYVAWEERDTYLAKNGMAKKTTPVPSEITHTHTLDKSRRRDSMFPLSFEVLISMSEVTVCGLPKAMYFQTRKKQA